MDKREIRLLRLLHLPLAAVALFGLASLTRPAASLAPPAGPGERWLWFDGAVRFERWHPPVVTPGPSATLTSPELDRGVHASARGAVASVTSQRNGGLVLRTYDAHQFNLWSVLKLAACLSILAALAEWLRRKRAGPPAGQCRCGYDLTGNVSGRCPECGRHLPVPTG